MSIMEKEKELERISKEVEFLRKANKGMNIVNNILAVASMVAGGALLVTVYKKSK